MLKNINTRIKHKRDSAENWNSSGVVPLEGELIVYSSNECPQLKIGDGVTDVKDLPFAGAAVYLESGDGDDSLTRGENTKALSEGCITFGENSSTGLRGYYYNSIDFTNKKIVISKEQSNLVPPTNFTWVVGDKVSITNDEKYVECSTITEIKSGNPNAWYISDNLAGEEIEVYFDFTTPVAIDGHTEFKGISAPYGSSSMFFYYIATDDTYVLVYEYLWDEGDPPPPPTIIWHGYDSTNQGEIHVTGTLSEEAQNFLNTYASSGANVTITVNSLPFTKIVDPDNFGAEDRGICVPEKPEEGEVEFGWDSYSFGIENNIVGKRSFAAGYKNKIYGDYGIALGSQNKAGYIADAIGCKNTVMGKAAFGCGHGNTVPGQYAFAANGSNESSGYCSSATGYKTKATHQYSSSKGYYTHTSRETQSVVGKYNKDSNALFVVGNGTSTKPSNAWESFEDGSTKQGGLSTAQDFYAFPDYGEYFYQMRNAEEFSAVTEHVRPSNGTFTWTDNGATYQSTKSNNWIQKYVSTGFVSGSEYKFVKVRYRAPSTTLEDGHVPYASLYWRTLGVGGDNPTDPIADNEHEIIYTGGRNKLKLITDGQWHDVVYDLSAHSRWDAGMITLIRWQFSAIVEGPIYFEQFGLFKTAEEAYAAIPSVSLLEVGKGYDKNQIIADVLAALPTWEGGSY